MSPRWRGIDHLGVAVSDLAAAREVFEKVLGLRVVGEEVVEEQGVRVVLLDTGDGGRIELLEATGPDSPIARHLARRGPGIHHVTLRVEDLDAALRELAAAGVELVGREPRRGAHGRRIAFLHPRSTAGILVELCEIR